MNKLSQYSFAFIFALFALSACTSGKPSASPQNPSSDAGKASNPPLNPSAPAGEEIIAPEVEPVKENSLVGADDTVSTPEADNSDAKSNFVAPVARVDANVDANVDVDVVNVNVDADRDTETAEVLVGAQVVDVEADIAPSAKNEPLNEVAIDKDAIFDASQFELLEGQSILKCNHNDVNADIYLHVTPDFVSSLKLDETSQSYKCSREVTYPVNGQKVTEELDFTCMNFVQD